jgi:hypothetical protein
MTTTPARACYYVSAIDGPRKYLIAGPYPSHDAALAKVQQVRDAANERDGRAWFMAWGTAGSDEGIATPMGTV